LLVRHAAIGVFAMAGTIVYKLAEGPRISAVFFVVLGNRRGH
jgi:hypothetical protein